jgi:hypothetical protein
MGLVGKVIFGIPLWITVWAGKGITRMLTGLAGFLMYRGGRLVAGFFWLFVFGTAVRNRDWIAANAPWGYGIYTNTLLLIGLVFFSYWLLLPKIRTWRYQRLTAKAAAVTAESQQHLVTVRVVGARTGGAFWRWRQRFSRHPSERIMDADERFDGDAEDDGTNIEATLARVAAEAARSVKEDLARGRGESGGGGRPKRPRDPKRRRSGPNDPYVSEAARIRAEVRDQLDQMAGKRTSRAVGEELDAEERRIRDLVHEELRRLERGG